MDSIHPSIEILAPKTLVGMALEMSLVNNQTQKLFRTFMPRRNEIAFPVTSQIYDLREYPSGYFSVFNPATSFTKWALKEVSSADSLPVGMQVFQLVGGKHAVFTRQGSPANPQFFQYVFSQWLPQSGFQLDDRPHFDILEENARLNPAQAKEEYWIPIK